MNQIFFSQDQVLEVDLHRMELWEANQTLTNVIMQASNSIREIVVIHGYHQGTKLMNFVRYEFKHKRIKNKFIGLNNGRTSLILGEGR